MAKYYSGRQYFLILQVSDLIKSATEIHVILGSE